MAVVTREGGDGDRRCGEEIVLCECLWMFLWDVPDAHGYVVAASGTLALGLADLHQPASGYRKPSVDVLFVRRLNDRLAVATDEGKDLDPLFHR
jgi:hypothetical protein